MPRKMTDRLTISQFNVAVRELGYKEYDDLPNSMTAAKAVLVFNHSETHTAKMFGITPQAVSWAVRRTVKAYKDMPGHYRLCPACGREWED